MVRAQSLVIAKTEISTKNTCFMKHVSLLNRDYGQEGNVGT